MANAVNEFGGGVVLVSHDMRLISQVAKEIWICDNKTITRHVGDIESFKMEMRAQMGIHADPKSIMKGDASVQKKDGGGERQPTSKAPEQRTLEVTVPKKAPSRQSAEVGVSKAQVTDDDDDKTATTNTTASSQTTTTNGQEIGDKKRYVPLHLRK